MRVSEFSPGLIFVTTAGCWRCTDVGRRTVSAIAWDACSPWATPEYWDRGPPYAQEEKVLTEEDLTDAHLDEDAATAAAFRDYEAFPWRTFPSDIMTITMKRWGELRKAAQADPHHAFPMAWLRSIRARPEADGGHEFKAYGAHRDSDGAWVVEVFDFHAQALTECPLEAWLNWPIAPHAGETSTANEADPT